MQLVLPFESLYILYLLQEAGFEAFLVGGALRDALLEITDVQDFDFTTNAEPQEIQALFPKHFYENQFGTVSVTHQQLLNQLKQQAFSLPEQNMYSLAKLRQQALASQQQKLIDSQKINKVHQSLQTLAQKDLADIEQTAPIHLAPFEITTFRSDGHYQDHRRPQEVSWGKNIKDDLARRDFTINALAVKINQTWLKQLFSQQAPLQTNYQLSDQQYEIIDHYQGLADLKQQVIRTVGPANQRFQEDALRMLRAVRFSVQLGMTIDTDTYLAIKKQADSLRFISQERIGMEAMKILASPDPAKGIELLDQTGLLELIMPELKLGKGVNQRGHHISDVWHHSLDTLRYCPSFDPVVRLAALLHDVGKPTTYQEENQQITFYNHEILGSRIASKIAKRLRLPKKDVERVFTLVRYHMFYYQPEHTDASIRRFIKKVGLANIDDILDLREGDRLGSGAKKTSWRLEEMKQRVIDQLNQPLDLNDLAIDGHDLMDQLKLKPGPILGQILNQLLEQVIEDPQLNDKEHLLLEAAKISKQKQ